MNINEFERNKPKKTYRAIEDLEDYLAECEQYGLSAVGIETVQRFVEDIKNKFLKGE